MEKSSKNILRIAITGPESTGKTTLAKSLAQHYHTVWVPEYAREYLENLGREYVFYDLEEIAKGQIELEKQMLHNAKNILFADTELLVIKIWSIYKYGTYDSFILENILHNPYDLYLLTYPDLPWEYDPLREAPSEEERKRIFDIYETELKKYNFNYCTIKEQGQKRINNAINCIEKFIFKQF